MTRTPTIALLMAWPGPLGPEFAARAIGRSNLAKPIATLPIQATREQAHAFLKALGGAPIWMWGTPQDAPILDARLAALGFAPIDTPLHYAPDVLPEPWDLDTCARRVGVPAPDRAAARTGPQEALLVFETLWRRYLRTQALSRDLITEAPDLTHWTHCLSKPQAQMLAALRRAHPSWDDTALAQALMDTPATALPA